MAEPQLPQKSFDFQEIQKQLDFLQEENGQLKLQKMNKFNIKLQSTKGCSDTNMCTGFEEKQDFQYYYDTKNTAFQLRYQEFNSCSSKIKGQFINQRLKGKLKTQNLYQEEPQNDDIMYNVEHQRNCCILKGVCSVFQLTGLGFLCFYGQNCMCPPNTVVYQENQKNKSKIRYKMKYSPCVGKVKVYEINEEKNLQSLKYLLVKQPLGKSKLYLVQNENQFTEVEEFRCQKWYAGGESMEKVGYSYIQVDLPENKIDLNVDDKQLIDEKNNLQKIALLISSTKLN